jgi:hypothetical protein
MAIIPTCGTIMALKFWSDRPLSSPNSAIRGYDLLANARADRTALSSESSTGKPR